MSEGGGAFGRSAEIVTLLRSHGLGPLAARTALREGQALRRRTEMTGLEFATLIDVATGEQVAGPASGSDREVDIAAQMRAMHPGRRYVNLHTHPFSTPFSDRDVAILLAHPELRAIIVVGRDGSWYMLSKRRSQPTASPEEGLGHWLTEFLMLTPRYDQLVESGQLTEQQATRQQLHEILVRIAPALRLRYDRL